MFQQKALRSLRRREADMKRTGGNWEKAVQLENG